MNNGAAAVLLVLAALARGRDVVVSRGEAVEIGGGFRVPEVMSESGARLVEVGTTNRTRLADYERAAADPTPTSPCVLKVHPSNYRIVGFTEARRRSPRSRRSARPSSSTSARACSMPRCPWLPGGPPRLAGEASRPPARPSRRAPRWSRSRATSSSAAPRPASSPGAPTWSARAPATRSRAPCAPAASCSRPCRSVALAYLRRDGQRHPVLADGHDVPVDELRAAGASARRRRGRSTPSAVPGGGIAARAPRSRRPASPSTGDHTARSARRTTRRSSPACSDDRTICDLRTVDPPTTTCWAMRCRRCLTDDPVADRPARVVATAGHVDHGKSTLVLALTGTDPDRFAEEKRRGLTIDLGFACGHAAVGPRRRVRRRARPRALHQEHARRRRRGRRLPVRGRRHRGLEAAVRGAPAHPRAARHHPRAWSPSPRSTSSTTTRRELARLDVADHVAGTFLDRRRGGRGRRARRRGRRRAAGRRSTACSRAHAGAPSTAAGPACGSTASSPPRGAGTVVTGTLTGGALASTTSVVVGPAHDRGPGPRPRRRLGESREPRSARATGSPSTSPASTARRRGSWRRRGACPAVARRPDGRRARCTCSAPSTTTCRRRGAYLAYARLGRAPGAGCGVLGADAIAPGGTGSSASTSRSRCPCCPATASCSARAGGPRPSAAARSSTWRPSCRRRKARPDRSVDRVVAERGWVDADELEALTGERRPPTVGRWVVAPEQVAAVHDPARARSRRGRPARPRRRRRSTSASVTRAARRSTASSSRRSGPSAPRQADPLAAHPSSPRCEAAPFAPPAPDGVDRGRAAGAGAAGAGGRARRRVVRVRAVDRGRAPSWPALLAARRPTASPSPRSARRSARPASTPCRCSPSSTHGVSPGAGATSASPAPGYPDRETGYGEER